jgi:hypothetical protein
VDRHVAGLDAGQHAGVKRLARLLRGLRRILRAAGARVLVVLAGVGAAHARVSGSRRAGKLLEGSARGDHCLEAGIEAAHERRVLRRVLRPQLRELVGELALVAFELVGKIVAAEHRFRVGLERIEIAGRIRAVKAAAAHPRIRVMRILGLLLEDDDLGPEIRCLDRCASARRAEADDDDVRLVFGEFVQLHFRLLLVEPVVPGVKRMRRS